MFAVAEWGDNIPKNETSLEHFPKNKKKKKATDKALIINQSKLHKDSDFKVKDKVGKLIKTKRILKNNINKLSRNRNKVKGGPVTNGYKVNNNIKTNQNKNSHNSVKENDAIIEGDNISKKKQILSEMVNKTNQNKGISRTSRELHNKSLNEKSSELANNIANNKKRKKENLDIPNYDADNMDEIILNAKKNKLVAAYQKEDNEEALFDEKDSNEKNVVNVKNFECEENHSKKKQMLKALLENNRHGNKNKFITRNKLQERMLQRHNEENAHRTRITVSSGNNLRERMLKKLNAGKFRYLNQKLYTSSGSEAQKLFQSDPTAFQMYHQGYQQQVKMWPINPLDIVVKRIQNMPKTHLIADLGCGEAALSRRVPHTVRSFDLVATGPNIEVCDMAHTPLLAASMDVAVYCLALMGTDLTQYLLEANRILKIGGHLLIAEVESRFDNVDSFIKDVQRLGFTLKKLDKTHKVFFFMEFVKARGAPAKKSKLPYLTLKPCIYKRR